MGEKLEKNKGELKMKTLAQKANHNFNTGLYVIFDENGNEVYTENSNGYWIKHKYENNNVIYSKDSNGFWIEREYENNKVTYYADSSDGDWIKRKIEEKKVGGTGW